MERSRSEDAGSLYEMVIRSQRDRLDEQRSELPRTMPVEDVSRIVMSMQKGRIETQRAVLSSASQNWLISKLRISLDLPFFDNFYRFRKIFWTKKESDFSSECFLYESLNK